MIWMKSSTIWLLVYINLNLLLIDLILPNNTMTCGEGVYREFTSPMIYLNYYDVDTPNKNICAYLEYLFIKMYVR